VREAEDKLPRMADGTDEGRRFMRPSHIEDRRELNSEVTASALRQRAIEAGASRNGHGSARDVHP
jgi:hypothetical protein